MALADNESLPEELRLALAYTPAEKRAALATYFALDRRLGQIVANSSEPLLGQMRLAWWREMLGTPRAERPTGDAVLDAIGERWSGAEQDLLPLIEAWEIFITAETLQSDVVRQYTSGRSRPFLSLLSRPTADDVRRVETAGVRWVLADTAARVSDSQLRARLLGAGLDEEPARGRLPRTLRGLAVLEALAIRALKAGGRPLMEGRAAAFVALKAGLSGR